MTLFHFFYSCIPFSYFSLSVAFEKKKYEKDLCRSICREFMTAHLASKSANLTVIKMCKFSLWILRLDSVKISLDLSVLDLQIKWLKVVHFVAESGTSSL